jgi:hypothetical protein
MGLQLQGVDVPTNELAMRRMLPRGLVSVKQVDDPEGQELVLLDGEDEGELGGAAAAAAAAAAAGGSRPKAKAKAKAPRSATN